MMDSGTFRIAAALAGLILLPVAAPAIAQDAPQTSDYLERLKGCQTTTDPAARLECYDSTVSNLVAATEAGDVRLLDQEDIQQTRRRLFGFSLPRIRLFGGNDDEPDMAEIEILESTITRVNYLSSNAFTFAIADGGAVWQVSGAPARLRPPNVGDAVTFRKASLGSYFIRIDGQLGVKGRRLQ